MGNKKGSGQDRKKVRGVIFVRKYISQEKQRSHYIVHYPSVKLKMHSWPRSKMLSEELEKMKKDSSIELQQRRIQNPVKNLRGSLSKN